MKCCRIIFPATVFLSYFTPSTKGLEWICCGQTSKLISLFEGTAENFGQALDWADRINEDELQKLINDSRVFFSNVKMNNPLLFCGKIRINHARY